MIEKVKQYEDAANRHDIALIGSLVDEDVFLEIFGQITLKGRKQIQALHEYDAAINTRISLYDFAVERNVVSCRNMEKNDWLSKAGIDQIDYSRTEFMFNQDGLIRGFSGSLEPSSADAMGQVLASFTVWAAAHRPEKFSQLFDVDGSFVYKRESGVRVLILLDEWRASGGG